MKGDDDDVMDVAINSGPFTTEDGIDHPPPAIDGVWIYMGAVGFRLLNHSRSRQLRPGTIRDEDSLPQ